jgi:8-amino-7-oxononanoate synthase
MFSEEKLIDDLKARSTSGLLRSLRVRNSDLVDFSSNDYLGLAHTTVLRESAEKQFLKNYQSFSGAGGSRLLSGHYSWVEETENILAEFFSSDSALVLNSGYDANVSFFSAIPKKGDFVFYDELVHASIHDGMRLSFAKCVRFRHNDLEDLCNKIDLQNVSNASVFVAVESVYSMDGDFAPLKNLAEICSKKGFALIVDEAHAGGIFGENGRGLCNELGIVDQVYARLFTFSKAYGLHGAVLCGSKVMKDYLINYARPFIFSTALPPDSYFNMQVAVKLPFADTQRASLKELIKYFRKSIINMSGFIQSYSAIQAFVVPGNNRVSMYAEELIRKGLDVRAVKSPTVKPGTERLRIILHSFNTINDINKLLAELSNLSNLKS